MTKKGEGRERKREKREKKKKRKERKEGKKRKKKKKKKREKLFFFFFEKPSYGKKKINFFRFVFFILLVTKLIFEIKKNPRLTGNRKFFSRFFILTFLVNVTWARQEDKNPSDHELSIRHDVGK